MLILQRTLSLCLLWGVLLSTASAREPDWGGDKPLPIPPELQGLWARGRHCNEPKRQLRVTKLAVQFGTHKPVRSYYVVPEGFRHESGIVPEMDQPGPGTAGTALTYAEGLDFLFDYGNASDPEQIYYRCPARKPRNP